MTQQGMLEFNAMDKLVDKIGKRADAVSAISIYTPPGIRVSVRLGSPGTPNLTEYSS